MYSDLAIIAKDEKGKKDKCLGRYMERKKLMIFEKNVGVRQNRLIEEKI